MKVTINLQLNLCLQRVTNDLEDGIQFTVHLLHQIEVETNERSMNRRDMESSHKNFNQDRILPCSMTSGSAGCSRPTLCIVLFYERINEELVYIVDQYIFLFNIIIVRYVCFSPFHHFT